jgi:flagellar hook-associated protein 1 FlgK
MSVSDVLQIGLTSLFAQKTALSITGENIANVNTQGYSKQTVILEPGRTNPMNGFPVGSGVQVASIRRVYDDFLQQQLVSANSSYGGYNTQQTALQRVQQLFNEFSTTGLGTDLNSFFNAWQDLANNPSGQAERQAVLSQAQTVVSDFHQMNSSLTLVQSDANQSLQGETSDINDKLTQIAYLNDQISQMEFQGQPANEMRDSREQLLRDLAGKVGITSTENSNGTVTVTLSQGPTLVDGNKAGTFSLKSDPANAGFYDVMLTPPGATTPQDVTSVLAGSGATQGEIGAILQVRDSLVKPFLDGLDELASNLATQVNSLHSTGFDLNGNSGVNFFTPPSGSATLTPGYSSVIDLNITSCDQIAAAASNPKLAGNGTGDNVRALSIANLANTSIAMSSGNSTLDEFYNSLVAKAGVAVQGAERGATQSQSSITQLEQMRDSASGVSLDEELTNLMTYQKAYEGAAKVITTGTEMLDTVLGMIR